MKNNGKKLFNKDAVKNLQLYGSKVYYSYLALEFLVNKTTADFGSIKDQIQKLVESNNNAISNQVIYFGQKSLRVNISQPDADGKRQITFVGNFNKYKQDVAGIKAIKDYSDDDIIDIIGSKSLTIQQDGKSNYTLGIDVQDSFGELLTIGGVEKVVNPKTKKIELKSKIDLRKMHITNLGKMLQNVNDPYGMLIALPTGSGKTFTQAVWMQVLYMANVNGCFNTPGHLTKQFIDDVKDLVSSKVTNSIVELKKNPKGQPKSYPDVFKKFSASCQGKQRATLVVSSWQELLKNRFKDIMELQEGNASFSFDEMHKAMYRGQFAAKLKKFAEKHHIVALTATPDLDTYTICGEKALVTMSTKDKIETGSAVPSDLETFKVPNTRAKQRELNKDEAKKPNRTFKDKVRNVFKNLRHNYNLALINSFANDVGDPSKSIADKLLTDILLKDKNSSTYYSYENDDSSDSDEQKIEKYIKNNINVPFAGRQSLMIVKGYEDMVNCFKTIEDLAQNGKSILECIEQPNVIEKLKDGKHSKFNRANDLQGIKNEPLLGLFVSNVDEEIERHHRELLKIEFEQKLKNTLMGLPEQLRPQAEQRLRTFYENATPQILMLNNARKLVIDQIIRALTKLSVTELDEYRHNNLPGLMKKIEDACKKNANTSFEELVSWYKYHKNPQNNDGNNNNQQPENPKGIDEEGAREVARVTQGFIKLFHGDNNNLKRRIAECHWLDCNIFANCSNILVGLDNFARKNIFRMLFGKFEGVNYEVNSKKSFSDLQKKVIDLSKSKSAKKSKSHLGSSDEEVEVKGDINDPRVANAVISSLEDVIHEKSEYTVYDPIYDSFNSANEETIIDNYLINYCGFSITSEKTEGFNNLNLDNVFILAFDNSSSVLKPEELVQGLGRLRGNKYHTIPRGLLFVNNMYGELETLPFVPEDLNSNDFYTKYFKAREQYKEVTISNLAKYSASRIRGVVNKTLDEFNQLDQNSFTEEIAAEFIDVLRQLDINNVHKIAKTRQDFRNYLQKLDKEIVQVQHRLRNPVEIAFILRLLLIIISFLGNLVTIPFTIRAHFRVKSLENRIVSIKAKANLSDNDKKALNEIELEIQTFKNVSLQFLVGAKWSFLSLAFAKDNIMNLIGVMENPSKALDLFNTDRFKQDLDSFIKTVILPSVLKDKKSISKLDYDIIMSADYAETIFKLVQKNRSAADELFKLIYSRNTKETAEKALSLFGILVGEDKLLFSAIYRNLAPVKIEGKFLVGLIEPVKSELKLNSKQQSIIDGLLAKIQNQSIAIDFSKLMIVDQDKLDESLQKAANGQFDATQLMNLVDKDKLSQQLKGNAFGLIIFGLLGAAGVIGMQGGVDLDQNNLMSTLGQFGISPNMLNMFSDNPGQALSGVIPLLNGVFGANNALNPNDLKELFENLNNKLSDETFINEILKKMQ